MYLFVELFCTVLSGVMLFQSARFGYAKSAAVFGMWFGSSFTLVVLWVVDWFSNERK